MHKFKFKNFVYHNIKQDDEKFISFYCNILNYKEETEYYRKKGKRTGKMKRRIGKKGRKRK